MPNSTMSNVERKRNIRLIILIVLFIATLMPIFIVAGYDCASGDDYNYGARSHLAYIESGSIVSAINAAAETTAFTYQTWQGTWFDVFVFCLHPEVFSDEAYVIVPFIFLIIQSLAFGLFAHHFLKTRWEFTSTYWLEITVLFLMFMFQLVPSQKSSVFWWVGCVHYAMPICMAIIGIVLGDRYIRQHKTSDIIVLCLISALIGGATYPAALLLPEMLVVLLLCDKVFRKNADKRNLLLILPIALDVVGLAISAIAPGNSVRSASDIANGAAPSGGIVATILKSIIFSVTDAFDSFIGEKAFILIAYTLVVLISWNTLWDMKKSNEKLFLSRFSHPIMFIIIAFLVNASMYAPRLYAGNHVSSGYFNFNFQIFFIATLSSILYIEGFIVSKMSANIFPQSSKASRMVLFMSFFAIIIIAYCGRHGVKRYTDYVCMDYYLSGQADDYKEQMILQRTLMQQEGVDDVILPEVNPEQGPLMQMPVVSDPDNVDNYMTALFYGKNSCRSIPRPEWEALYGN